MSLQVEEIGNGVMSFMRITDICRINNSKHKPTMIIFGEDIVLNVKKVKIKRIYDAISAYQIHNYEAELVFGLGVPQRASC